MKPVGLITVGLFVLPLTSLGAVTINEIAWMGNMESANHEWIELYNDGGSQNLDGWVLTDGENLSVELAGQISGDSYAVLERTSDDSAPGAAFLMYTGALKNTGATLSLYRADGTLEDRVGGGENWQNVGGDNVTKETAQYTTSGWVTADATPGQQNKSSSPITETENDTGEGEDDGQVKKEEKSVKKSSSGPSLKLELPGETLELSIEVPERIFVNQPVNFSISSVGVGKTLERSLRYQWNFGDTTLSNHKNPTHVYSYPGTYVVHVRAAVATQEAEVTKEVTVLPIELSLTTNAAGDVQINNDSVYPVELSQYALVAGKKLEIPEDTWLLDRQTITIPKERVSATQNTLIALYDAAGTLVASVLPEHLQPPPATAAIHEVVSPVSPASHDVDQSFGFVTQAQAQSLDQSESSSAANHGESIMDTDDVAPSAANSISTNWPVLMLVLLLSVSCVVVLVQPLFKKESLDNYGSE